MIISYLGKYQDSHQSNSYKSTSDIGISRRLIKGNKSTCVSKSADPPWLFWILIEYYIQGNVAILKIKVTDSLMVILFEISKSWYATYRQHTDNSHMLSIFTNTTIVEFLSTRVISVIPYCRTVITSAPSMNISVV